MPAPADHKRRFIAAIRQERLDIGDAARRAGLTFQQAAECWADGVAAKRLRMADDLPGFRYVEEVIQK
jgi:hypothetical protein